MNLRQAAHRAGTSCPLWGPLFIQLNCKEKLNSSLQGSKPEREGFASFEVYPGNRFWGASRESRGSWHKQDSLWWPRSQLSGLLGVEFLGSVSCHTASSQTGGRSWGWPRSPAKKAARPCLRREVWGGCRAEEGRGGDRSQGESCWFRSLKCRPFEDAPQAVAGQDRAN